jgi:hypothetical protein
LLDGSSNIYRNNLWIHKAGFGFPERRYHRQMDVAAEAARLRAAAEARPLKLPANRRLEERHHLVTADGLGVWFTIQLSPHSRITEALFERSDNAPRDDEIGPWLSELMPGKGPVEAPGLPGARARRFEVFEPNQETPGRGGPPSERGGSPPA